MKRLSIETNIMELNTDQRLRRFRHASRQLYNNYFFTSAEEQWLLDERFMNVQSVLFREMVVEPLEITDVEYGEVNADIRVCIFISDFAPIMINREINSGYWDYPMREVQRDAIMSFVSFFDFSSDRGLAGC